MNTFVFICKNVCVPQKNFAFAPKTFESPRKNPWVPPKNSKGLKRFASECKVYRGNPFIFDYYFDYIFSHLIFFSTTMSLRGSVGLLRNPVLLQFYSSAEGQKLHSVALIFCGNRFIKTTCHLMACCFMNIVTTRFRHVVLNAIHDYLYSYKYSKFFCALFLK